MRSHISNGSVLCIVDQTKSNTRIIKEQEYANMDCQGQPFLQLLNEQLVCKPTPLPITPNSGIMTRYGNRYSKLSVESILLGTSAT
jgi:hypothetical protein